MDKQLQILFDAAKEARTHSHAPYSGYHVGAAVLDEHGHVHAGCNVENVAYPLGSCAEVGAISAMVMRGGSRLREVLVMGPVGEPCTPCGGCRQRLREFGREDLPIHVANPDGIVLTTTLGALLPHAFGPDLGETK
ncbi:MAG: cytidine deaminase [Sphingomonadales bacterium]|jgi:cytidine deaminase